ncbi:hypothetical protein O3M35_003099 [Rhynocoris fuscipes]|uniref:Uncharacterized protein n=1 Tax=Rhynocoris fuscipes TaxID=488301 RepID=A0AAW1CLT6_9HEMI
MGCSATKVAIPVTEPAESSANNTEQNNESSTAKLSETFTVPADTIATESGDITISARTSNGLAFEVPMNEDENVIKKHPPKRFQRLEDQQITGLTHRLLDEKQAEAEQRRLQILSQRIQSAKNRQKLKRPFTNNVQIPNNEILESMHQEPTTVAL